MISSLEDMQRRLREKLNRVAQETKKNHMLVGGWVGYCFYQPHNYRLYFDYNRQDFNPKPTPKRLVFSKKINATEYFFEFNNFSVRVKKNQIEVRNFKNHKEWYKIEVSEKSNIQISRIIKRKDKETIKMLQYFIKWFGGRSEYKILNRHSEDKIKGEDKIDILPIKQKFHNEIVKKVYNEQNIEFSSPAFALNYISNRAIENISPEISNALYTVNPLRTLKMKVKKINDIFVYKDFVKILTKEEKAEFEEWIFETMGV